MAGTIKISISMPEGEYKALETARRKAKRTRSQYIREALVAGGAGGADRTLAEKSKGRAEDVAGLPGIKEERGPYDSASIPEIMDIADVRRRAIAAAGRFDSGVPDLSLEHDKYLTDADGEDRDKR